MTVVSHKTHHTRRRHYAGGLVRCCYSRVMCMDNDESWTPEALERLAENYVQIAMMTLGGAGQVELR
jgi:hypothetical protein